MLMDDDEKVALWLDGEDVFFDDKIDSDIQEDLMRRMPHEYIKRNLNVLEDIANDLRKQADRLR